MYNSVEVAQKFTSVRVCGLPLLYAENVSKPAAKCTYAKHNTNNRHYPLQAKQTTAETNPHKKQYHGTLRSKQ